MMEDRKTEESRNQASAEKAVVKTLVYRDLFDYPLKAEEIRRFLIEKKTTGTVVKEALVRLESRRVIAKEGSFYFLSDRKKIVSLRRKRQVISERKMKRANRYAALLRFVPWVRAIFVTGAVAAGNAEEKDDLDILTIVSPQRLWLTRLFVFLILIALGAKRRVEARVASNKVCPNMFFSVSALRLPKNEQNLYTAYEIAQVRPLWERSPIHQLFLAENSWIKRFLPNWKYRYKDTGMQGYSDALYEQRGCERSEGLTAIQRNRNIFASILDFIEEIAYKLQIAYMARRRTKEIVTRERILFHSSDLPAKVLEEYHDCLKEILTD
jgi:hypothetical protein